MAFVLKSILSDMNFPGDSSGKESAFNVGDLGLIPGSGRSIGGRKWQPTPVFLSGGFCGQRSPWSCKEADATEH